SDNMVPCVLLGAPVLFSAGGKVTAWINRHHTEGGPTASRVIGITALQLCVAVYIGYFGAGVGIVMLALLSMMGLENIHSMNGLKTLLATCGNAVAVVVFIFAHAVMWPQAVLMVFGGGLGGYAGAWYAQKLDPKTVRYVVIAIGYSMTTYFFWRVYLRGHVWSSAVDGALINKIDNSLSRTIPRTGEVLPSTLYHAKITRFATVGSSCLFWSGCE